MNGQVDIPEQAGKDRVRVVLDVGGLLWASEQNVVAARLGRRPGVAHVEVNPVAQAATVVFDPGRTSVAELRGWVQECGYHCAGQSVPSHVCDPLEEPVSAKVMRSPQEATGHAGGHGGHRAGHEAGSMQAMVADLRNRFLVALLFSIPIVIWSPIGTEVLGLEVPVPVGLRQDVWALLLSLPVIFYSSWIFFRGAYLALRAKTLDMMVLVAVAIGTGWIYSVAATFLIEGDVFYEAAAFLLRDGTPTSDRRLEGVPTSACGASSPCGRSRTVLGTQPALKRQGSPAGALFPQLAGGGVTTNALWAQGMPQGPVSNRV
ncbi:MAG: cation transporter, partial [Pseudonocardiaceae bacterium]